MSVIFMREINKAYRFNKSYLDVSIGGDIEVATCKDGLCILFVRHN